MTDSMTPQQIAHRTSAALAAAVSAGRDLGLSVTDARVLHDVFSALFSYSYGEGTSSSV